MNWQALLPKELETLAAHLTLEKALVNRAGTKLFICFLSDALVGETEYLALQKAFRGAFRGLLVSLRVASPALAGAVRENLREFVPFLTDCLARTSPGLRPWLEDASWSLSEKRLSVGVASEAALAYVRHVNLGRQLEELMRSVFRLTVEAVFFRQEDAQAQAERLRLLEEKDRESIERVRAEQAARETSAKARKARLDKRIYGTAIKEPPMPIGEIMDDSGRVTVRGEVMTLETKQLKGGEMLLLSFQLTDYTGTVTCKAFLRYRQRRANGNGEGAPSPVSPEEIARVEAVVSRVNTGDWLTVRGDCQFDRFAREPVVMLTDIEAAQAAAREDRAEKKRVELHLHTQMSSMDGVAPVGAFIRQAAAWGHPAIAVTDHGVVQAFPDAFAEAKKHGIKLIPGMEGYLVDEAALVENPDNRPLDSPIVALDFETTGLSPRQNRVIEIGAVRIRGETIEEEFTLMIDPEVSIPQRITDITGITTAMVKGQPTFAQAAGRLMAFIGDAALAAHNASFDMSFLREELGRLGLSWQGPVIDTLAFARKAYPSLKSHRLGAVCRHLRVKLNNAHRAVNDARATAQALQKMMALAREKGAASLASLNGAFAGGAIGEASHVILLATSQTGMTNLNRLVSLAHLRYFYRRPHIPRSILQKHREGILVGSACESGELYRAILAGREEQALERIARFYDYLEIQPTGNNAFLIREGQVRDEEELRAINRRIVALGEKAGIPTVATGDAHFLRPEDGVFRAILMSGKGFENVDDQPPLYLRTTDEMLEEFAYLGPEKAREVVVDAPGRIAGRVGEVRLFPPHPEGKETFQPYWESAAEDTRDMAWSRARELYGETLPAQVEARLNKELGSITGYGFATLYSIAEKLVKKSLADGYLVGSRGSVGSSFVATLCGITEVNPLPPHYLCPNCHFVEFDERHETASMGVDLPPRECPVCGQALGRDGFDIPFEVFLGFKGDKVPDIDLNFSGVYQARAHKYVEELFGADHVFRAGTIGTLAEKTAFGYVTKYLEERGRTVTEAERRRLIQGCVGVKRTTGQHPGGIVVLPKGYEIYEFTAIQRPADDMESATVTTHYDFASMHDVLVKLDILGHDDPTMINMLQRLTGVDPLKIPLGDPEVMALFTSPAPLKVAPEDIRCATGTLGIPEFGTRFVRGMLEATKPRTMEELVRISGLSHGTDVWLGNAADLIASGTATLSECICTRDDIMNALMLRGVAPIMAFTVMESVRKGKGLTPDMEAAMRQADTPQWFIDSCRKIQYMFPKAHAVAYVMMALRIAWFKIHYPAAYYAAYFSVRADVFDVGEMSGGAEELRDLLDGYDARWKELTNLERDRVVLLEIALEMNARGVRLLPMDLYASDAEAFRVVGEGILPPFTAIPGLGLAAAQSLVEARKAGAFLSVEDLKARTKVTSAGIEQLRGQGVLRDLAENSQVSLF